MARTQAGAALTQRHRERQLQTRAAAARDYQRLWPIWVGTAESFNTLVSATIPLVETYHRVSSGVAVDYYQAFRMAEDVPGSATPRLADPVNRDRVVTSMRVTGRVQVGRSLAAGMSPQAAMAQALVTTTGAVTRHVLNGGRGTLIRSMQADPQTTRWARVTAGSPCGFCAMLASRGPVYRADTAEFEAHDHCACSAEPHYEGSRWPPEAERFREVWDEADGFSDFRAVIEGRT